MSIRKIALIWAAVTPIILLASIPLADAANQSYLKAVVALFGFLFVFTSWAHGKMSTFFAIDIGQAAAALLSRPSVMSAQHAAAGSTSPPVPRPPIARRHGIVLVKKSRTSGDIKSMGTSWLGGLPALGGQAWPRERSGRPMHHLMQVDLADATERLDMPGLPTMGSLAFFIAGGSEETASFETAVSYIDQPSEPTPAPADLAPAGNHTYGGFHDKGGDRTSLNIFPRWAVDLVAHDFEQEVAAGEDHSLMAEDVMMLLPNGLQPSYWESMQRFVRSFEASLGSTDVIDSLEQRASEFEADLASFTANGVRRGADPQAMQHAISEWRGKVARMRQVHPELLLKAQALREWAFAQDPWTVMSEPDLEAFKDMYGPFSRRAKGTDEQLFYAYSGHQFGYPQELARETFRAMIAGPDVVFDLLPDEIRDLVDVNARTPKPPHQMFGQPVNIQTAVDDNEHNHLLMQVACDHLLGMGWGDAGAVQFWISPQDLSSHNWSGVVATFEGH